MKFFNWSGVILNWGLRLWKSVEELFPERQLFIRSRGRVHFLTLSKQKQMALLLIPLVPLLVIAVGALSLGVQQAWVFSRDLRIVTLLEEQRHLIEEKASLSTELSLSQEHYSAVTNRLERKHAALDRMLRARTSLERRVSQLRASLIALETELKLRRADHASLSRRYEHLREQLTQTSYLHSEPEGSLVATPKLLRLALGKFFEEGGSVETAPERPKTEFTFEATNRLLALTATERDTARLENSNLQARTKRLENRLAGLQEMQDSLIARIESGTEEHIDELERVIKLTGLDVEGLLERIENTTEGIGGPFIGIASPENVSELTATPDSHPETSDSLEDRFSRAVIRMGAKLARWSALSTVAESLPLAAPVLPYRITSRFGKRRDPFTKRWARHEGVDLAAPYRSPILATAPGRVSFVGWKGPYGRMIEIDHGYGLKTRYGHLYRIYVKRGEKVAKWQRIAVIGSSGRSTGRHLHYEVHYDDQLLDPTTFLKAGDHVFKDGQK